MRTEILKVTPKMAAEFLSKNNNNRKISKTVVRRYSTQMENNEWLLSPDGLSFDLDGNIVNGQHRLSAVIESKKTINFIVTHDVPKGIFAIIDTGKNRSGGDVLSILKIKNSNITAACVRRHIMLSKNSELNATTTGRTSRSITNQNIIKAYNTNNLLYDELVRYSISLYSKVRIYGVSDTAAIMSTLIIDKEHSKDDVLSFFKQLFTGYDVSNYTITLLREKLLKNLYSKVKLTSRAKNMLVKKTWNCYVSGKELKVLQLDINKESGLIFK